jgi:hypothetical protein
LFRSFHSFQRCWIACPRPHQLYNCVIAADAASHHDTKQHKYEDEELGKLAVGDVDVAENPD